jgi:SAM-dependent methyltransferase
MTLTPQSLDAYAEQYYQSGAIDDIGIEERAQLAVAAQVGRELGGAGRVLEMGYGTGDMTAALLDAGVAIEVVEGSPLLCRQGRAAHAGLVVHEAMFESFVPDEPYDAVLALFVLEHVDDPVSLLRTARSWLRPGGSLIAVVPNAESLHRQLAVRMGLHAKLDDLSDRDRLVGHLRVYDLAGLRADAEAAGLEVVGELGSFVKVVHNALMADWPEDVLDGLNAISDVLPPRLLANAGIRAVRR